ASGTSFLANAPGRRGGEVVVWDVATGRPLARLAGFDGRMNAELRFDASGEFLLERSFPRGDLPEIGLWTLEERANALKPRLIRRWEGGPGLAVSADGRRFAAYEEDSRLVIVVEASSGRVLLRLPRVEPGYRGAGLSEDGRLVATAAARPSGGPLAMAVW